MNIKVWEIVSAEEAILHGEIQALSIKVFAKNLAQQKFPNIVKYKLIADNGDILEFDRDAINDGEKVSYVNWEVLANTTEEVINELYDDLKKTFVRNVKKIG